MLDDRVHRYKGSRNLISQSNFFSDQVPSLLVIFALCVCLCHFATHLATLGAELVEQGSRGLPSPGHHTHTSDLSSYCMLAPAGNLVLIRHVASLARLESSSCLMFASPHSGQIAVNICGDLESEDQMERTRYCPVTHLSHLMLSTSNGEFRNYF